MKTPMTNGGLVTASIGYDAVATSIVLSAGHGSRLPQPSTDGNFPLFWWNTTEHANWADDPNKEIVTVTARTGDTLTVTRGAEGTGASTKNDAGDTYRLGLGITKAVYDELTSQSLSQVARDVILRTDPSNDVRQKQVRFSAAAISMSDREEVEDWDNIPIDISVSGIGGLDTGAEQNDTWYGVYAAYDGVTKDGFFHRLKNFLLDEESSAGEDATQGIRAHVDNSTIKVSQGFQNGTAGVVPFVDVKLLKVGAPTGNLWFTIEGNNGGVPDDTPIATSIKIDVALLQTTAQWVRIPFLAPVSLSAATQYHLVAQGDYTVSATVYVGWRMDGSAGAYANGSKALWDSDGPTWTADADDDMMFKVYVVENDVDVSTTAPAGYTYALIGFAFNNSAGDLVRFNQVGRTWRLKNPDDDGLISDETPTSATLHDLFLFVPPLDMVELIFSITGTAAAAASMGLGDRSNTDLVYNSGTTPSQVTIHSPFAIEYPTQPFSMIVDYSCLIADASGSNDIHSHGFRW